MNVKYKGGTKADTAIETARVKDSALTCEEILKQFRGRGFGVTLCRS
jgi:hypothetical protein